MIKMNDYLTWTDRADEAFNRLVQHYWNEDLNMFNNTYPCMDNRCNLTFHYWWYAHALDSLVDVYERTKDGAVLEMIEQEYKGILFRNGGSIINALYDDMEWMALALLRVYEQTRDDVYLKAVFELWEDIQTGWNDHQGGGIAWQKSQLDYKNTPANGPAAILGARLFRLFGKQSDLDFARNIFDWLRSTLVHPETGFVMDGINRLGDGRIDSDWKFTYCQGVYIGAAVELYRVTGESSYLDHAQLTATHTMNIFVDAETGAMYGEGDDQGDAGLFKGILVRYLAQLIAVDPERSQQITAFLRHNAEQLWHRGSSEVHGLFHYHWGKRPQDESLDLSVQLSAHFLMEVMAILDDK